MSYKLLFIDDDEDLVTAWKLFLDEAEEVNPSFAMNGTEARKLLEKESFDVIISDVSMPDGEGVSVINYVIKQEGKKPLFIFLTGSSHIDSEYLVGIGANKVFYKPVEVNEVLDYISEQLKNQQ